MKPSQRVLYTSSDVDAQGGALRCLFDMAREIGSWGYEPMLAVSDRQGSLVAPAGAATTIELPFPRPRRGRGLLGYAADAINTVRTALLLAARIRRDRVSLVHVNEILDVYGGVAAWIARVPCVWHVRADISGWPEPLRKVLAWIVARLATRIIVVSESVRTEVFSRQGIDGSAIVVLHDPGPDPEVFRPDVDGSHMRRELQIPPDAPLVVLVAKLVEPKGHAVLIRAAPKILASFPNARFVIVGGDLDGDHHRRYAEGLRALPSALEIAHAVIFTGFRTDVAAIMASADVVAHCSTHPDPFPGVVLQGMALGKVVVASDCGGPREQIEHDRTGILVPPGDAGALADAITALFADGATAQAIGRAAASHARRAFTSEAFYARLTAVYDAVLAGSGR